MVDIFNFDETGLFWRKVPTKTLATERMSGTKVDKHRISVGVMTNADGTEKLPLLFISHAKRPRCFKKKDAPEHGFHEYYWNKKAWMTGGIFKS